MLTTRQALSRLRAANPLAKLTEDRIRAVLRQDRIPAPTTVAGRFLWRPGDIKALARALGLVVPTGLSEDLGPDSSEPAPAPEATS